MDLPVYSHKKDETTGQWISTVKMLHQGKYVSFSAQGSRKTVADIAAAKEALIYLNKPSKARASPKLNPSTDDILVANQAHTWRDFCESIDVKTKLYVLIDYENVNKIKKLNYVFKIGQLKAKIFKFLSYGHHNSGKDNVSHIVHSAGSDSVDHAISMFVGMILMKHLNHKPTILVLTGDQFGERLQNMTRWRPLEEEVGSASVSASTSVLYHVRTEEVCLRYLETFGYTQSDQRISYKN